MGGKRYKNALIVACLWSVVIGCAILGFLDGFDRVRRYNGYMDCTKCGFIYVDNGDKYCEKCGASTAEYAVAEVLGYCTSCGSYSFYNYCKKCGGSVTERYTVHKSDIGMLDTWYLYGWDTNLTVFVIVMAIGFCIIVAVVCLVLKAAKAYNKDSEKQVAQ